MNITAKLLKYKVNRSYKRCIAIGNNSPRKIALIHVGKNFKLEDAKQLVEVLKGVFN